MEKPNSQENPHKSGDEALKESSGGIKKIEKPVFDNKVASTSNGASEIQKEEEEVLKENCKWCQRKAENDNNLKYWNDLKHNGPVFAPPYVRLPKDVKFFYEDKEIRLTENAEEAARFYAEILDNKEEDRDGDFKKNFFEDWKSIIAKEGDEECLRITDFEKCDFTELKEYSKKETKRIKSELKRETEAKYGYCTVDGKECKILKWIIEFPGLFQGKTGNSNRGKIKKRIKPEDVTINCSEDHKPDPPAGHFWKAYVSDPTVTWLAKWTDPIRKKEKYIEFHASSPLKGSSDEQKYWKARHLHVHINTIRKKYRKHWTDEDPKIQQRGVALYLIDVFAFRVGNKKYENSSGCCTLRVKDLSLQKEDCVVHFKFYEKGSQLYENKKKIKQLAFKRLQEFIKNKNPSDSLFNHLNADGLDNYLSTLMTGLTAHTFRTYKASLIYHRELDKLTNAATREEKISFCKQAALKAAALLNHHHHKLVSKDCDQNKSVDDVLAQQFEQLKVKDVITDSKTTIEFYLDPRITVAWCKKNDIPIEDVLSDALRKKFDWAIKTTESNYCFEDIEPDNVRRKLF